MKKITKINLLCLSLIAFGAAAVIVARLVFAAGTATLSLTPATGTFSQGDTVSVNIYEDSGGDTVNAVQANFSYPSSLLSFVGITDSSAFGVVAQNSVSGGNAQIARGATTAVSGNQLVATVRFTALAGGNVNLSFTGSSAVIRSTDNGAETLTTNDAAYTLFSRASLYITPATKSFTTGADISAAIYEDSGATAVNAVQANLSYPSNVTFASIDAAGSAFPIAAQGTGSGGSVMIGRGTTTPVTGAQLIATVHFTAASAGTAVIPFTSGSAVIRSSDNGPEALTETGASYSISAPSTPGTGGSPPTTTKPTTKKPASTPNTGPTTSQPTTPESPPVTTNFDAEPPAISKVTVTNISANTATITWETSEEATSEVDYGLNTKYVLNVVDPKLTKNHSLSIDSKNLLPNMTYHFQVKGVDEAGNLAFSKDLTFSTKPANAKSRYGNFWAAFAVIVIIAAGAFVGSSYIRRMKGQSVISTGPQGNVTPDSSRQSGGAVITPDEPAATPVAKSSAPVSGQDTNPHNPSDTPPGK
jgi:hypothetical protein